MYIMPKSSGTKLYSRDNCASNNNDGPSVGDLVNNLVWPGERMLVLYRTVVDGVPPVVGQKGEG